MDVWLLRHAAAEERSSSGRDEDRSLTRAGAERAAAVGRGLARLAPAIETVLTSPYRRARETARAVAAALALDPSDLAALEPGRAPSDAVRELTDRRRRRSVLLVGHQPLLGEILGLLVHGDERFDLPLAKAAVAKVSWDPDGGGSLQALLPPEFLERLA